MQKFIQVDEEGYFKMGEIRVVDPTTGFNLFKELKKNDSNQFITNFGGTEVFVEAFDQPLVAEMVHKNSDGKWQLQMPYQYFEEFELNLIGLDEWDRFLGHTVRGIPFVLSHKAQDEFFNLLDGFEDEAIIADGKRYETPTWLVSNEEANKSEFWNNIYVEEEPRWDIKQPNPGFVDILPEIKLIKARILVLGAGQSHDAAFFAEQGHIVTALDISEEGIFEAKKMYSQIPNLKFEVADAFNLPIKFHGAFDIVIEHKFYCAISPERRNELVKVWRQVLDERGHLLGVFAAFDRRVGPPYGGSEWEFRERLEKSFRVNYWRRLKNSIGGWLGKEVLIYAEKIDTLA